MEHCIAVDAVVLGVAAACGIDPPLIVALLSKQVVEVKRNNERLVTQESLGHLSVPDEFVSVHGVVVISSPTSLMKVAADLESCRQSEEELSAIVELPSIEIGIGL